MSEQRDREFLRRAIALSEAAVAQGARPFGSVVCDGEGRIVSEAGSVSPVDPRDWTAHSEMQALRAASATMSWDALGAATIYASGEPCPMCAGALVNARVTRVVYGCDDPKAGAVRTLFQLCDDVRLNHRLTIHAGLLADECATLLREFFQGKRRPKDGSVPTSSA